MIDMHKSGANRKDERHCSNSIVVASYLHSGASGRACPKAPFAFKEAYQDLSRNEGPHFY